MVIKVKPDVARIRKMPVFPWRTQFCRRTTRIGARNLMRTYYRACKEAGIENLCFHDLRRAFASRLVRAGSDPFRVRRLMRQKDPSVMDRYAHLDAESLREAVEILDQKNDKKMTMGNEAFETS